MKYFKNEYPNNIIIFDQDTNKVVCRLMHYDFNNEEEAIEQAEIIVNSLNETEKETEEARETHDKLREILIDYNSPEFGDCIVDDICSLFNFSTTIDTDPEEETETEVIENSFFIIISQEEAKARLKRCECIYRLYPDGTETLIEDENELNDAVKDNCSIGIEEEETKDLFENYEEQPENVKSILAQYEDLESLNYEELAGLQKNLETIGYTFDYGLDAQPYNLRKI